MTCKRLSVAASVGIAALALGFSTPARAITVDDFGAAFSGGGLDTGVAGFDSITQGSLPVLGGTRTGRAFSFGEQPTGAQMFSNPNPPPATDIIGMVLASDAGGRVELSYPQSPVYDVTLGQDAGSVLQVRSTLSVAGAGSRVSLRLQDETGTSNTRTIPAVDFSGMGDTTYLFWLNDTTFTGVDLEAVEDIEVSVEAPFGTDFELSDISIVPLSPMTTNWITAVAFQRMGMAEPAVALVVDPMPVSVNLSDPMFAVITLDAIPIEIIPVQIHVASYGSVKIAPSLVASNNTIRVPLTNAENYTLVVEMSSGLGEMIDPSSLVGFTPQPDPPGSLVGFNPQPEPPAGDLFGMGFNMDPGGGGGGAGLGVAGVGEPPLTLILSIEDERGQPIALQSAPVGVAAPAGGLVAWIALAGLLLVGARWALRERTVGPAS